MSGPWERFQSAETAAPSGPWDRYNEQPAAQPRGVMANINTGIASGVDSLAGPVNAAVNALIRGGAGVFGVEEPFQFTETPARDAMRMGGIDTLDGPPETLGETFLRGAGEAASFMAPFSGVLRGAATLPNAVGRAAQTAAAGYAARPAPNMLAELLAGGSARATGELAARGGASEWQQGMAEIGGGLAGGVIPAAVGTGARAVANTPFIGTAARTLQRTIMPWAGSGAEVAAAERLRAVSADPDRAAARLAEPDAGGMTPAQQAGEPGLASLERRMAADDPAVAERLARRGAETQAGLVERIRAPARGGTVEAAQDFLQARQERFRENMRSMVHWADARARARIAQLAPRREDPSANSVIVREELDRAYDAASAQERALWDRVPRDAEVPTGASRAAFAELDADLARALRADMPTEARHLLGEDGLAANTTVRELHGLYSYLRRTAREAMALTVPNENRARISTRLADAILNDLGVMAEVQAPHSRRIAEALAWSREMAETFGRGTVDEITARTRAGGARVAPELALQGSLGRGGTAGAVAVDDIRRAAPAPATEEAMQDYMRQRLVNRAMPRGDFAPDRAQDFMRDNREMLNRFPELRDQAGAATDAARAAQRTEQRVSEIIGRLNDRRQTITTAFLQAQPQDAVGAAIFRARSPVEAARAIRQSARRDSTGAAMDGVTAGVLDDLIRGSQGGGFNLEGERIISGAAMQRRLQDPTQRQVVATFLEPNQMRDLDRVAELFARMERAGSAEAAQGLLNDAPNFMIMLAARVAGARAGAQWGGRGGASIQTANIGSTRARRFLESLTNDRAAQLVADALQDRELMRALLLRQTTPGRRDAASQRLLSWARGTGAAMIAGDDE